MGGGRALEIAFTTIFGPKDYLQNKIEVAQHYTNFVALHCHRWWAFCGQLPISDYICDDTLAHYYEYMSQSMLCMECDIFYLNSGRLTGRSSE